MSFQYEENYPPSAIGRSPEGPFDLVDLRKLLGLNDETVRILTDSLRNLSCSWR